MAKKTSQGRTGSGAGARAGKKLKVRRETIRDLDAKKSGKNVKGGWGVIAGLTGACKTAACETADCKGTLVGCGVLIG